MPEPQRLLFDVTRLARSGLHTGIQRVVRCLLSVCIEQARKTEDFVVAPVSCEGRDWFAYPALAAHPLQGSALGEKPEPRPITPGTGDVLLFFDASWYVEPWLAVDDALGRGARLVGMVHDLLPLQHPDWFRAGLAQRFDVHLQALSARADLLFVPSGVVADHLRQRLGNAAPSIEVLAHGGDFLCAAPVSDASMSSDPALEMSRPFHLVVSTLEPRKRHAQVLDAFERLWESGHDHALVLVGAAGWGVDDLLHRLRHHPQRGQRLLHLEALSDSQLACLYRRAQSLIYLSHDEGFGLPVLEAAMLGCPVIAADIPVLREVGGGWPHYLAADDTDALVAAILDCTSRSCGIARPQFCRTWSDAGQQLVERLTAHGLIDRHLVRLEACT